MTKPNDRFDLYSRASDGDTWAVLDRAMPEAEARRRMQDLERSGRQAKIELTDPNYVPDYSATLLSVVDQLDEATRRTARLVREFVASATDVRQRLRVGLRNIKANVRSLEAYFGTDDEILTVDNDKGAPSR